MIYCIYIDKRTYSVERLNFMRFATKVKISFAVIIIFPLTMVFFFMVALSKYQVELIEERYSIKLDKYSIMDSTNILDKVTESYRKDMQESLKDGSINIEDENELKNINASFLDSSSYIVVYKGDEFVYNGKPEGYMDVREELPIYEHIQDISVSTYYVGTGQKYIVKPVVFHDNEGKFGTIYIIGKTGNMLPEVRHFIYEFVVVCIFIIFTTAAVLTFWIYKSVLRPLRKLTNAAKNIKEGNLNVSIDSSTGDEFGEFCKSFDEMRAHLKNSIEESLLYDAENRELISNISHDLKTPITAIKGYVEGIMDGVADTPEKMDKYIRTIYNKANDMDKLIGELTVYSKIDLNAIPYHFIKLNVEEYFSDCISEIETELENKNFKLTYFNYTDKNTEIMADPEQLKRVINNIISNSLKYNDKKEGIINIRIKDQQDFVHFEIEDNGKGVSPTELPYIFERFYRADTSRNSKKGGSGIGLSIVKKIIEAHGGTIWAFSTVDTGLSIHFMLKKAGIVAKNTVKNAEEEYDKSLKRKNRASLKLGNTGGKKNGK